MKTTKFLPLLALFALLACNQKNAENVQQGEPMEQTETDLENEQAEQQNPKPTQVVGFQKTACFGKCPVYQVKFFSDGSAVWDGKMNVERMGPYEAQLPAGKLKEIRDRAHAVGYFDFYEKYPTERRIADLPSTITYLRVGDMEKTVKNTHDGPEALAEFEQYLLAIIDSLDWKMAIPD